MLQQISIIQLLASGVLLVCLLATPMLRAQQAPQANPPADRGGEVRPDDGVRPPPRAGAPAGQPRDAGDRRGEFGKAPPGILPGRSPEGRSEVPGDQRGPLRGGEGRRPGSDRPMGPEGRPGFPGFEGRRDGRLPMGMGSPGIGRPPDWQRMQQEDPEMYQLLVSDDELDRQALEMAEQVRRAKPEEREKLKATLKDIVGKHFEVRQQRRELQLKRMEEEIQRLRDAIKTRNDAREDVVNKRITELTGDVNPLDF